MAEQTGNGLDVGSIVEDVDSEGMAGTVPADMLVYAGTLHPPSNRLTTALVRREVNNGASQRSVPPARGSRKGYL